MESNNSDPGEGPSHPRATGGGVTEFVEDISSLVVDVRGIQGIVTGTYEVDGSGCLMRVDCMESARTESQQSHEGGVDVHDLSSVSMSSAPGTDDGPPEAGTPQRSLSNVSDATTVIVTPPPPATSLDTTETDDDDFSAASATRKSRSGV